MVQHPYGCRQSENYPLLMPAERSSFISHFNCCRALNVRFICTDISQGKQRFSLPAHNIYFVRRLPFPCQATSWRCVPCDAQKHLSGIILCTCRYVPFQGNCHFLNLQRSRGRDIWNGSTGSRYLKVMLSRSQCKVSVLYSFPFAWKLSYLLIWMIAFKLNENGTQVYLKTKKNHNCC